jgi:hypothetical protein
MRRISILGILASGLLALVACEKEITDGRVPAEHVAQAQALAGEYQGSMDKVPGRLVLSVDASNRAHLQYYNRFGNDLLNGDCDSSVGALKLVDVRNNKLRRAEFAFNEGKCHVQGDRVIVWVSGNNTLHVQVLERLEERRQCQGNSDSGVNCSITYIPVYIEGEFRR